MSKFALAVLAVAMTASPVAAGGGPAYSWGFDPACGGTDFQTCISGGVRVSGQQIVVDITNIGPGVITGVGLWGLGDIKPLSASTSILDGWDTGGKKHIQGVVGSNHQKYAIGTTNGINDGLLQGSTASFSFLFGDDVYTTGLASRIGIGIHSQGVGECSSKLFVTSNGSAANEGPYKDCGSVSVPEPGSMLLLATGAVGLAFIRRRRNDSEIGDEDGNELDT